MKILLSNKYYYRRGGDCIYTINLEQLLKSKRNNVAIFAMDYPQNIYTPWNKYFPSEVKFTSCTKIIETTLRPFGTKEVKQRFSQLLKDFRPEVVHVNNIHSQLSPIITEIAHEQGIRVIWTIHDYKLLCPRYDCLKNGMTICEECFRDKNKVLKYKCMKNSRLASILAYWEAKKWNIERIEANTDMFICPSKFMAKKMIQGGYSKDKIKVLNNFFDSAKYDDNISYEKEDYYCYVGRISQEKGIETLIKAANDIPYKLIVIGDGPLLNKMRNIANNNIEFVGYKDWDYIKAAVSKAHFTVLPSEWYENNPLSIIESQCLGTPVLGADIGGIPELIEEGINGMTFESKNLNDLKNKIEEMFNYRFDYDMISNKSKSKYNSKNYYKDLMSIYQQ